VLQVIYYYPEEPIRAPRAAARGVLEIPMEFHNLLLQLYRGGKMSQGHFNKKFDL
jgi:hypothetical protein